MFRRDQIEYKTPDQIRVMRRAGLVVARALHEVRSQATVGMTTADLDEIAAQIIAQAGATPSFVGYHGYPATLCVSVNDEVVHGIPGGRVLHSGDIVSVDCGAIVDGWHGDSAVSWVIGEADPADAALVEATRVAMWDGIAMLAQARRLGEIGDAIDDAIQAAGAAAGVQYGIVEEYTGHGIGTAMHQPPDVVNFRAKERGPKLRPGMCLAIEPMITRGGVETQVLSDDWTVVTRDGSRAAHWEHTAAILPDGLWVLTAEDGGEAELTQRGVSLTSLAHEE